MNCDMTNHFTENTWHLAIEKSNFNLLDLTDGIIMINSDEYLKEVLNNLTVSITNPNFSKISLTGANSLITVTTSLIGNDHPENFSIVIRNCLFSEINAAEASAIYSSVESLYQNVLLLDSNDFRNISSSSSLGGGILNPSTTMLSPMSAERSNDATTIKITNNTLLGIESSEGGGVIS